MPTYEMLAAFRRQFGKLDDSEKAAFRRAVALFVNDLRAGQSFHPELRIHKLVNTELWSMTWANDGRAIFRYGNEIAPGETHIIWELIGTHAEVYNFKR